MTLVDYVGATLAVIIFTLLAYAYFYAFRPQNKEQFNEMRNFVNEEK